MHHTLTKLQIADNSKHVIHTRPKNSYRCQVDPAIIMCIEGGMGRKAKSTINVDGIDGNYNDVLESLILYGNNHNPKCD